MAHFAKLGPNNIVEQVIVVHNNELLVDGVESEEKGIEFLHNLYGDTGNWKQTSYNNNFRKNHAGIGFRYDETLDAFIPPNLYPSWPFNKDTCVWEPPVVYPDDGEFYIWNEVTTSWDVIIGS